MPSYEDSRNPCYQDSDIYRVMKITTTYIIVTVIYQAKEIPTAHVTEIVIYKKNKTTILCKYYIYIQDSHIFCRAPSKFHIERLVID